jgi:eukaryotic-like serine/threonine-protein kinase
MIFPNTGAFLEGSHQPQDNVERLALLGVCRFDNRHLAVARLYADAFAADPKLADDPRAGHRYRAACAAALAGCGGGRDGGEGSASERVRWRTQARAWLQADLTAWAKMLERDPAENRLLERTLTHWRAEPDLAALREPRALAKLPAKEREEWLALWNNVDALLKRVHRTR